jgi:JmjC domain, hydroxylase
VLHLTTHPLRDALAHLPQALMMISLHSYSLNQPVEDLDLEGFRTIQSVANEAASGTLFPWGYGGHYRTFFGIHFEDAWMPSANLHVAGAPKIWVFLRKDDFTRLSNLLSRTYVLSCLISTDFFPPAILSPCFTYHRSLFIHPKFLIRHGIRFTVARQTTGDMIIAGSTSAHLGWNVGPNLAVAANFLDAFSIDIILREVMNKTQAPWPCACELNPVPPEALAPGTWMNLPIHHYMHESVSDVGSTVFEWIHRAQRYIRQSKDFLLTDTDNFALAWRYLHAKGEYAMDE